MSCNEEGDKDSIANKQQAMKRVKTRKVRQNTASESKCNRYRKGDSITLAQVETGTDQDCTNQGTKDQKIAEQFRLASPSPRTKRQHKTIPIKKQRNRLQLREKVEIYKKITKNHMSYKQVLKRAGPT